MKKLFTASMIIMASMYAANAYASVVEAFEEIAGPVHIFGRPLNENQRDYLEDRIRNGPIRWKPNEEQARYFATTVTKKFPDAVPTFWGIERMGGFFYLQNLKDVIANFESETMNTDEDWRRMFNYAKMMRSGKHDHATAQAFVDSQDWYDVTRYSPALVKEQIRVSRPGFKSEKDIALFFLNKDDKENTFTLLGRQLDGFLDNYSVIIKEIDDDKDILPIIKATYEQHEKKISTLGLFGHGAPKYISFHPTNDMESTVDNLDYPWLKTAAQYVSEDVLLYACLTNYGNNTFAEAMSAAAPHLDVHAADKTISILGANPIFDEYGKFAGYIAPHEGEKNPRQLDVLRGAMSLQGYKFAMNTPEELRTPHERKMIEHFQKEGLYIISKN